MLSDIRTPDTATIATTERLLSEHFGGNVKLGEGRDLGGNNRSQVYRFSLLDGPSSAPESVIVKQANSTAQAIFDPRRASIPALSLFNDWAGLQFLNQVCPEANIAPQFYVGEHSIGLFVMEDMGQGPRLDHILLSNDPVLAEQALIDFARIHGRLHASTNGQGERYNHIRSQLGPSESKDYTWLRPTLDNLSDMLEIKQVPGAEDDLISIENILSTSGSIYTFIQGDSCPDNCLYVNGKMRLLDFEGCGFSHSLLEGAYCRLPFPSCRCAYRLPEQVQLRVENAYRMELSKGCPSATDDVLFYRELVAACLYWTLNFCRMVSLKQTLTQDRTLIALSDRQRFLLFFENTAYLTEISRQYEALGARLRTISNKMRVYWSKIDEPPYYPAFRVE